MGDDIAALIGRLKLGKADVMGYSLGSGNALVSATPRLLEGGKQLCEDLERVRKHYKKAYGEISTR